MTTAIVNHLKKIAENTQIIKKSSWPEKTKDNQNLSSETGRLWFRRVLRCQTPSSVSFFCPPRVPGGELSQFLSAYYLCAKANSPSFFQNSESLLQNSVTLSEFSPLKQYSRNSIPPVSPISGTESAILNRESVDSESCDSNRAIPRSL